MFQLSIMIVLFMHDHDILVKRFLKKTLNSVEKYTYFCEVYAVMNL